VVIVGMRGSSSLRVSASITNLGLSCDEVID
jgi:hypothetical protein